MTAETRRRLWPHQARALDFAIDHLNSKQGGCLIRMPTGTGKTGVIACLTRLANDGTSLVLTPWANLRVQMIEELETGFWTKRGLEPNSTKVVEMMPSRARHILDSATPQVIVATFATLNELRREHEATYEQLAKRISLVVVDECHYEPAVEWGRSVKKLGAPMVLLTATPYRNDLKLFRISDPKRSAYHFTHKDAVAQDVIRSIRFEKLDSPLTIPELSRAFARLWKTAKRNGSLPSKEPRAIICCSQADDIESAVQALQREGLSAIGLHERFEEADDEDLVKYVPKPDEETAEIWVHQHKLTEGLDDHRFCCLALFTRVRNDRKLIQQVGRILRRDSKDRALPAVLVAPSEYAVEDEWNAYLAFETNFKLLEPQHFRDVVDTLLESQPEVEYFDGRFRRRFRPDNLALKPQVVIPPSVLVRTALKSFVLEDYIEACTDTLNTKDAVILGRDLNKPCLASHDFALWVYASVRNSRFLQNTSLYEISLETHCVVHSGEYLLVADSRGILPREYLEDNTAGVSQEILARFLDNNFRPTHVSVDSSIPYDTALRGQDMHGHNLLSIPPSLTDRIQICRSARGTNARSERRYIGISSGRLRKEETADERRSFEPSKFVAWAHEVSRVLVSRTTPNALFRRYMPTCEPPASPVPKTICIDLLRLNLDLSLSDGTPCQLVSPSADITEVTSNSRTTFECLLIVKPRKSKTQKLTLQLAYEPSKRRFWFTKKKGPAVRISQSDLDDAANKSLSDFLNQKQDIILIGLADGDIVYQDRNFYRIDYSYAEKVLVDLIQRPKAPNTYSTEKGTKEQIEAIRTSRAQQFPEHSVFRAIADDNLFPFDSGLLVCTDLGTECADFIAAGIEKRELALIHAKAGDGKGISASAFHDVVAQAMKNLVYLTPNAEVPKGVGSWRRDNQWNRTAIPRLYRAPAGVPVAQALWNRLRTAVLGASNPQLHVVLVTTGCCDIDKLRAAISHRTERTPEVAQLIHLLDGLHSFSRQLGVRLHIYDLPYSPRADRRAKTAKPRRKGPTRISAGA